MSVSGGVNSVSTCLSNFNNALSPSSVIVKNEKLNNNQYYFDSPIPVQTAVKGSPMISNKNLISTQTTEAPTAFAHRNSVKGQSIQLFDQNFKAENQIFVDKATENQILNFGNNAAIPTIPINMNESNNFSQMNNFGISSNINTMKPHHQQQHYYNHQEQSGYISNYPAIDNRNSQ